MDLGIGGRRAAVAAGSAGLGLGTARALAAEGVQVAICGRDAQRLAEAASSIGEDVITIVADLAYPEGGRIFVREAIEKMGGIDILVTNSGGPPPGTFSNTDLEAFQAAFDMNCKTMIEMCRMTIPAMQGMGWGRVCAITSVGVKQPIDFLLASSVARAALTSFLKITAREVASEGITINSVQPGIHWTHRVSKIAENPEEAARGIPAGTTGDPDDFGSAVAFLCSEQARFITGTGLLVDGGQATGLLD
jgi:3-oxoacyl-[acyl-carrier protein] reductase